ncbi:hypothetical protein A2696_01100 [Candidatus Curtissbacteria bacterium RIFCSPHIGHO2_01_FULL_41_13]|uniref:Uncharacterized protein n=1 Tax=Candidatus Curtissbacteria bacterium RIFCSPHIGHO2_01_FULL_41_13 TaxID=1797745 RepID=A0A1F5G0X7_9BACT|nr:MAG: hypothetical protein A2696_01100 [Candidatus Curtissbacteria bacterium RIFCSPHIGHO2_01_FULL_41_13]
MGRNPENTYTLGSRSRLGRPMGRRRFLGGAFLAAAGAAAGYLGVRAITDEYGSPGSLDGKPVEGDRGHLMVLTPSSEYPKVWVRAKPSLSEGNIVGWAANPGALVQVREYHGKVYPSDSSVGNFKASDGNNYGLWGRIQGVEIHYEEDGRIKKKTVHNMFVSFNFLTEATEEEKHQFYSSRE